MSSVPAEATRHWNVELSCQTNRFRAPRGNGPCHKQSLVRPPRPCSGVDDRNAAWCSTHPSLTQFPLPPFSPSPRLPFSPSPCLPPPLSPCLPVPPSLPCATHGPAEAYC